MISIEHDLQMKYKKKHISVTEDHKKEDNIVFLNAIIPSSGLKRLFTINVKHTGKFEKSSIEVIHLLTGHPSCGFN